MDTSAEKYINRIVEILDKKLALLTDMLKLTEAQTGVINEGAINGLQKLVDEKQLKIDAIDKLDEEFAVYFGRLKSSTKINSAEELDIIKFPDAKRIKEITSEILKVIGEISSIEKLNSIKSKELLNKIGGEIKKLNQGKKVKNAYNPASASAPSYFLDKKK